jgi:hypothetical protein
MEKRITLAKYWILRENEFMKLLVTPDSRSVPAEPLAASHQDIPGPGDNNLQMLDNNANNWLVIREQFGQNSVAGYIRAVERAGQPLGDMCNKGTDKKAA